MFRNIMHQECKYEKRKWKIIALLLKSDRNNQEMVSDRDSPALPSANTEYPSAS